MKDGCGIGGGGEWRRDRSLTDEQLWTSQVEIGKGEEKVAKGWW